MNDLFGNWIYKTNNYNTARFVLGEKGDNPLVCIGVNPSTAEPGKLDPTLRRVKSFSKALGFNGWIMLNLYPQRATDPDELREEAISCWHRFNLAFTRQILLEWPNATIWAAWGVSIKKRKYLAECLGDIYKVANLGHRWITIGKRSQAGHPHHPLYLPNDAEVKEFNVVEYLNDLEVTK